MAGIKISELEKLQEIQGNEEFPVAKEGNNYSVTSDILLKSTKQENINLINYINKYVYDVSELFGKLAYRSGVKIDEKNIQGDGYFNKNGILVQVSGSGFVYQKSEVDPSKIYHIKQSNGIYSLVSILVLFDENDEIIQIIPYDYPTVGFDKYFIFKGVKSIGISFIKSQIDDPKFLRFESFDIQDLTTLINDTIDKFEEVDEIPEETDINYNEEVNNMVRQKYSLSEELAILRQRDSKPEEFAAYNEYAEYCKAEIKKKLNIEN
jgi:hypothetical protein